MFNRIRGFTLIELLVVIAIIAILAAILFPMFITAKHTSKMAGCQSNMKQLVMAATRYADDYDGKMCGTFFGYPNIYGAYISKKQKPDGIYLCPVKYFDPTTHKSFNQSYGWSWYLVGPLNGVAGSGNWSMPHCDLQGIQNYNGTTGYGPGRLAASVANPTKTPWIFEGFQHQMPNFNYVTWGWAADDAFDSDRMLNLHKDGANYAFVDGHIKWYTPGGLQSIYVRYEGLDYDGNGTVGTANTIR